jgi:hypothetical protein
MNIPTEPTPAKTSEVFEAVAEPWEPQLTEFIHADPPPAKGLAALYSQWVGTISRLVCRTYPHEKHGIYPCYGCQKAVQARSDILYP